MTQSPAEQAAVAAYNVPIEVSTLILNLGQARLNAMQVAGVALDARTTQIAAFQLAGAVFAGGVVAAKDTHPCTMFVGLLACLAFVFGAFVAFQGIKACSQQVAGIEPSFWADAAHMDEFNLEIAHSWAAKITQEMIDFSRIVDETRARYLNLSIIHGIAGGALIAISVITRLYFSSVTK